MYLTAEQLKGKIKNEAKSIHANAPTLLRLYMMERFLERVSLSRYRERFVIKGGILVTALVGVALRSTMDIDASLKNFNLSEKIQTILARGILNTRMRDFYDIRTLWGLYGNKLSSDILQNAFSATCRKRKTPFTQKETETIAAKLETDSYMLSLWETYRKKYPYAKTITYEETITSLKELLNALKLK